MKNTSKALILFLASCVVFGAALEASAVGPKISGSLPQQETKAKERAGKEIGQRIDALKKLSARINELSKVSDSQKSALTANLSTQIAQLQALQTKIENDADSATLKADMQTITKAYRIYALVMPQTNIIAAADRALAIAENLSAVQQKIQARIAQIKDGAAQSSLQASNDSLSKQIAQIKTDAQAAIDGVKNLLPDNGDSAKSASNKAALKAARDKIKSTHQDIQTARKTAGEIAKTLKQKSPKAKDDADQPQQ